MKIYNTKYALTSGITEHEAEIKDSMAIIKSQEFGIFDVYLHGEGKDWHKTKESAIARAEGMKIKKLQTLDKQIKKISKMSFN